MRLVHPLAGKKYVSWIDPETREISSRNRSPKKEGAYDLLFEMVRILPFVAEKRLTVLGPVFEMDEYRMKDGWGRDGKRGSHRFDRVPLGLYDSLTVETAEDYAALVPEALEEPFTSAGFAKASGCTRARAQTGLLVLTELGTVIRCGRQGRAYTYMRKEKMRSDEA